MQFLPAQRFHQPVFSGRSNNRCTTASMPDMDVYQFQLRAERLFGKDEFKRIYLAVMTGVEQKQTISQIKQKILTDLNAEVHIKDISFMRQACLNTLARVSQSTVPEKTSQRKGGTSAQGANAPQVESTASVRMNASNALNRDTFERMTQALEETSLQESTTLPTPESRREQSPPVHAVDSDVPMSDGEKSSPPEPSLNTRSKKKLFGPTTSDQRKQIINFLQTNPEQLSHWAIGRKVRPPVSNDPVSEIFWKLLHFSPKDIIDGKARASKAQLKEAEQRLRKEPTLKNDELMKQLPVSRSDLKNIRRKIDSQPKDRNKCVELLQPYLIPHSKKDPPWTDIGKASGFNPSGVKLIYRKFLQELTPEQLPDNPFTERFTNRHQPAIEDQETDIDEPMSDAEQSSSPNQAIKPISTQKSFGPTTPDQRRQIIKLLEENSERSFEAIGAKVVPPVSEDPVLSIKWKRLHFSPQDIIDGKTKASKAQLAEAARMLKENPALKNEDILRQLPVSRDDLKRIRIKINSQSKDRVKCVQLLAAHLNANTPGVPNWTTIGKESGYTPGAVKKIYLRLQSGEESLAQIKEDDTE